MEQKISTENTVERELEVKAPISKVWSALTDSNLFGQWFGARFDLAFVAGKTVIGKNLSKGFEMEMQFHIKEIKPQTYFSYAWTPYPMDRSFDYSKEKPTLVEFFLQPTSAGTLIKVKESGFDQVTASRRAEAFKMHSQGWEKQLSNVENFLVEKK